jgi:transposase-like protein
MRDEDFLDEDFPLGDGTADTDAVVHCPYCGARNDIGLDPGSGADQEYMEDCQVCCQPWTVRVVYREDGSAEVWLATADE